MLIVDNIQTKDYNCHISVTEYAFINYEFSMFILKERVDENKKKDRKHI